MASVAPWASEIYEILALYNSDDKVGLNEVTVQRNRKLYGENIIPAPEPESLWKLILKQFEDTLVLILLGAAAISFALALFEDSEDRLTAFMEPAVILVILICNATVGVLQETNAEAAIEKLKEFEAQEAKVLRNGELQSVKPSEIVLGDIVEVSLGDKVPADCRVIQMMSAELSVDQSILTGESENVNKNRHVVPERSAVVLARKNMLFSGTLITRGKAHAVVTAIGPKTEIGAIADSLREKEEEEKEKKTPLQDKLDQFGEQLSKIIGIICIVVWLINIGHFTDPEHGNWIRGAVYYFKIAVALAVAAIPEGLPAVVTTCLALGTVKMAKKNAIVRKLPSVETLGCTTVICSDKTGTLTTNMMTVQKILVVNSLSGHNANLREFDVAGNSMSPFGEISDQQTIMKVPSEIPNLAEMAKIAILCNDAEVHFDAELRGGTFAKIGTATEAALVVMAEKIGHEDLSATQQMFANEDKTFRAAAVAKKYRKAHERVNTLDFTSDRKMMSVLMRDIKSGKLSLFVKGAAERILARCSQVLDHQGRVSKLSSDASKSIKNQIEVYAKQGLRCLALARKENPPAQIEGVNRDLIESDLTFVGVACVLDPPREEVQTAIAKCRDAGIRVIVITGDLKATAEAICTRIGVFKEGEDLQGKSYTGEEFMQMTAQQQSQAVKKASLFSRVEPLHKLRLVELLQEQKEVVAMTGDGVNDAPALKRADIGIAMGSGTAVARQASAMVLQDDNFATIIMAVEEGRTIYANTKQFIRYLISSNIGEVVCIFLTAALGMPEALIPVQLLWVNLVTDGLPATALGFNPADPDVMSHRPRGRNDGIINGWMFTRYMIIGVYVGAATILGFIWWFLFYANGPQVTWAQLTNFHACTQGATSGIFANFSHECTIFHDSRPCTVSLSVLVVIEMFNALNALSENQSLVTNPPWVNRWVIVAIVTSMALHFTILYVPFFQAIFSVAPLSLQEWEAVLWISFPVIIIDEVLKFVSRAFFDNDYVEKKRL